MFRRDIDRAISELPTAFLTARLYLIRDTYLVAVRRNAEAIEWTRTGWIKLEKTK